MQPAAGGLSGSPEALIAGLAATGDRGAFEELVKRRQSWLRNLMRRCCGDPTLADDLAQQVFLQAWRDIGKLRQPKRFGGWLKQLAINVWRQHLRKHDVLRHSEEHANQSLAQPDHTGASMDLDRALATLPAMQRLCVVLSYHEGMSHGEICQLTQLPAGTVKSHIRRGAQALQARLAAYQENLSGDSP